MLPKPRAIVGAARRTEASRGANSVRDGLLDDPNETQRLWRQLIKARNLLIVTASIETSIGLTLLLSPSVVAGLLLGATLDAPAALIVGRVAGAALLSLGGACWLARDDGSSRAVRGLIAMMLPYNSAAGAVLADAGARAGLVGVLMWPAVALHVGLAVWCVAYIRSRRVPA